MSQTAKVPAQRLPVVYFAFGHLALVAAMLLVALQPGEIAGFFYHSRMFVTVHLVTLGWITCSILGATYLVAPFAFRTTLGSDAADRYACGAILIGVCGIVTGFWLELYLGLAIAALPVYMALTLLTHRFWSALGRGKSPAGTRLIVALAYGNLQLAVILGVMLAINKNTALLPGSQMSYVFSHVHLAVVGWASMMVVGVGYRLFPMFIPGAAPEGRSIVVCAITLETGMLGLAASLPFSVSAARIFAVVLVLGFGLFLADMARVLVNPRKPPAALPRPDLGMLHAFQALCYLILSAATGLALLFASELQPGWIMVYGVFGLLGFLGQIVLGMSMRLLPTHAWMMALTAKGPGVTLVSPHEMPSRALQYAILALWTPGVPLLAAGLAGNRLTWVGLAGWLLTAAAVLATVNSARVLGHAFGRVAGR